MKGNIILLIIGICILILPIIMSLILREKRIDEGNRYHENKNGYNQLNNEQKIQTMILLDRLNKLEEEVSKLKDENTALKEEYSKKSVLFDESPISSDKFKPILNYNLFKEKNSKIIDLYEKGKTKEEIAKILNKSIREVEMVISLVK